MQNLENLSVVALLQDLPDKGLVRGQIGTVVDLYSPTECEVEFCDQEGRTHAMLPLTSDQLLRLHKYPQEQGPDSVQETRPRSTVTRWSDVEPEALNPHIDRQFIVGSNVMLARILLKKGAHVPLHSHHNEQVSYILEGALKFVLEGKEVVVRAGEVLCIPPHIPHEAFALEDTIDLDIFNPPRQDWIDRDDAYLRGATQAASEPRNLDQKTAVDDIAPIAEPNKG